jgi:hypothetical protein
LVYMYYGGKLSRSGIEIEASEMNCIVLIVTSKTCVQ